VSLRNCRECGKLFAQNRPSDHLCVNCAIVQEDEFKICREFVRNHPASTVVQMSEQTGIPLTRITGWIRDGRMTI
jgi:phage FluMu protein Com